MCPSHLVPGSCNDLKSYNLILLHSGLESRVSGGLWGSNGSCIHRENLWNPAGCKVKKWFKNTLLPSLAETKQLLHPAFTLVAAARGTARLPTWVSCTTTSKTPLKDSHHNISTNEQDWMVLENIWQAGVMQRFNLRENIDWIFIFLEAFSTF